MLGIRGSVVAIVASTLMAVAWPAMAQTIRFTSSLSAANEVPPANSSASGTAEVSYDTETRVLSWMIAHTGLSSPASAAHFHGPARAGENAPPIITITELTSPVMGTATLDQGQADQLLGELWYINFHTPAFPGGEIRGQVVRVAQ